MPNLPKASPSRVYNRPFLEAGVAAVLHCENQPYFLASPRPGETDGDTTLENWDPQSKWYVCESQQQRFTGFTLALLNINKRGS